jgi:type IV pilus assembly protein PilN
MIKINLLEVEKERRPKAVSVGAPAVPVFLIGGVILVGAIAAVAIWYLTVSSQARSLEKDVIKMRAKKKELEPYIKRVDELEARRNELAKKNRAIEELRSQRTIPVHILDEVSRALPEYLWLTNLTLKGGALSIDGETLQEQAIPAFMKSLDASEFIGSTSLLETRQKSSSRAGAVSTIFKLQATITNPFKPKELPETGKKPTGPRARKS